MGKRLAREKCHALINLYIAVYTLSNVDAGETAPTPVTTVHSLQNLMDANKFLVLFNVI